MIVYNVKRRWFEMKNDAEAYRRSEGLPPAATFKLEITDRAGLTGLLNALCGVEGVEPRQELQQPAAQEMVERNIVHENLPEDWMPAFLLKDYQR